MNKFPEPFDEAPDEAKKLMLEYLDNQREILRLMNRAHRLRMDMETLKPHGSLSAGPGYPLWLVERIQQVVHSDEYEEKDKLTVIRKLVGPMKVSK